MSMEILTTVFHLRPSCYILDFPLIIAFDGDERENMKEILDQVNANRTLLRGKT